MNINENNRIILFWIFCKAYHFNRVYMSYIKYSGDYYEQTTAYFSIMWYGTMQGSGKKVLKSIISPIILICFMNLHMHLIIIFMINWIGN